MLAAFFRLGLREGAGNARAHLADGRFLVLGVLLDQHVAADFLLCGGGHLE